MTMISSYYAQVGVGIDKSSLSAVSAYLGKIEKQMTSFQKRLGKSGYIDLKIRVDTAKAGLSLQRSLNTISRTASLNVRNINISAAQMTKALNQSLNRPGQNTRIRMGALLSQGSLNDMRNQIRTSVNSLVVSPKINPRISAARQTGSGRKPRKPNGNRTSPWHNPMMIGGGAGAFLRYGAYSLPFVAGAMGLNSLSNKAATLQSQEMMMNASIGDRGTSKEQMQFLSTLGNRLGRTTESMAPFYGQMYAGARGTELESQLPAGFTSLMEYGSVMGLNDESMKGSIRAISQMISKRSVTSEELRQQLAEHGMPQAVNIMAKVVGDAQRSKGIKVAPGDEKKLLEKMMKAGQVDPIEMLPRFFAELKALANPFLGDFYKSIQKARGDVAKSSEDWMKKFLAGGGTGGVAAFFRSWDKVIQDSIPSAERLGEVFKSIVHYFNAAMLAPGEFMAWFKGIGKDNNFMTAIFGKSSESALVASIKDAMGQIQEAISSSMGMSVISIDKVVSKLELLSSILIPMIEMLGDAMEQISAMDSGGIPAFRQAQQRQLRRDSAWQEANVMADDIERDENAKGNYGFKVPFSIRRKYAKVIEGEKEASGTQMPVEGMNKLDESVTNWFMNHSPVGVLRNLIKDHFTDLGSSPIGSTGILPVTPENSPYQVPSNGPSTSIPGMGGTVTVIHHIKQDPLTVNATVEARTDADAVVMEIERRTQEASKQVWGSLLSSFPIVTQ